MMHRLRKLLREIHRRSVWQVLGVYVGGSWAVLQAVDFLTSFVGLPEWTPGFALVLLLVGLPIVLATAIIQRGLPALTGAYRDVMDPNELPGRTPEEVHVEPGDDALVTERVFTWRNATLGGVGAAALLVGSVVAYLAMWALGIGPVGSLVAQGVIDERDPVILADFANRTDDAGLGAAVTDAFRVDLVESRVLTLLDGTAIQNALQRMGRGSDAPLNAAAAREVAVREGLKAVVEGDVSRVGTGYLLAARIVLPGDGHAVAAFRESAADDAEILPAIDRLSARVREKAGESLRDVRAGPPLEAVTTSSLEALRKFAEAMRATDAGHAEVATDLLKEAVALDPGFAMAWRALAVTYANRGTFRTEEVEAATRAWEERARLTERERQLTIANYAERVTGEVDEAVRAYRRVLEDHPDDRVALNNLATDYMLLERWSDAVALLERAVVGPARTPSAYNNLVLGLYNVGRGDEAMAMLAEWREAYPADFSWFRHRETLLLGGGDAEGALATVDEAVRTLQDPVGRLRLMRHGGLIEAARGRLSEAERRLSDGIAACDAADLPQGSIIFAIDLAAVRISGGADPRAELRRVDAEAERRLDAIAPQDRPYAELGLAWADYGRDADRAEAWWKKLDDVTPAPVREGTTFALAELDRRHWLALLRGHPDEALRELRQKQARQPCSYCDVQGFAEGFMALNQPDSAIAVLEPLIERPDFDAILARTFDLWRSLPRLARLYEQVGRTEDARATWQRIADRWAGADPPFRRRAAEARERAARLADGDASGDSGDRGPEGGA